MSPTSNVHAVERRPRAAARATSCEAGVHAWQRAPPALDAVDAVAAVVVDLAVAVVVDAVVHLAAALERSRDCHFAAGPAQLLYVSHSALAPAPYIAGCVAQPGALLNAASYFSSGDFTVGALPARVVRAFATSASRCPPSDRGLADRLGIRVLPHRRVAEPFFGSVASLYSRCCDMRAGSFLSSNRRPCRRRAGASCTPRHPAGSPRRGWAGRTTDEVDRAKEGEAKQACFMMAAPSP